MCRIQLFSFFILSSFSIFGQAPANDLCENAILIECGDNVSGTTSEATFRDTYNGCSYEDESDVWYRFIGTGQIVDFEFISSHTGSINIDILSDECNLADACIEDISTYDGQSLARRSFYASNGIVYVFRISTSCCDEGVFSFRLNCNNVIENDTCSSATSLTCGQTISSSTLYATEQILYTNCGSTRNRDVWYSIQGTDQIIELFTDSPYHFSFQVFHSSCSGINSNCIGSNFLGNSFTFFAEQGENYLINIYDVFNEQFNFSINCSSPIFNDECIGAEFLSCGDNVIGSAQFLTINPNDEGCYQYPDIWYKVDGDGSVLKFIYIGSDSEFLAFEIYENACLPIHPKCENDFALYPHKPSSTFLTEAGTEYLIRLEPNSTNHYGYDYNFSVECHEEVINDLCENAVDIMCGDQINGNLENATFFEDSEGCYAAYRNDIWYTFIGDGELYEFTILDNEVDHLRLIIYNEPCDSYNFNCFNPIELFYNSYGYNENESAIFPSQTGIQYWIRVSEGSNYSSGEFSFEINCIEREPNDDCLNAIQIDCTSTYSIDLNGASFSDNYNGCDAERHPDVWYSLLGDDNIYAFNSNNSNSGILSFRIYTNNCQNVDCFLSFNLSSNNQNYQFFAEDGVDYLIYVYSSSDESTEFSFSVSCPQAEEGDFCSTAFDLTCGTTVSGNTSFATFGNEPNCYQTESNTFWYELLGTGDIFSFEFGSSDFRYIRFELFEENCSIESGVCLISFRLGFGNFTNDVFNFPTQAGLTYYVKVELDDDSSGPNNGAFEFSLNCNDPLLNDDCETATEISCSELVEGTTSGATFDIDGTPCTSYNLPSVWYTIIGHGGIIELEYVSSATESITVQTSQSSCDENALICLDNFHLSSYHLTSAYFYAEQDSVYFLNIILDIFSIDENGDFSFNVICHDLESNDDCTNAIPLSCEETISGNTAFATTEIENTCFTGNTNDLWYSIEGDDALHVFEYISSSSNDIRFEVFVGSCDELGEELFVFYYSNQYNFLNPFFAYSGTTYLVRVTAGCGQTNGEFSFIHSCPEPYENDFCEDAIDIVCGTEYSGLLETSTVNYLSDICDFSYNEVQSDVWFTIQGDGLIYQFIDLINYSSYTEISIFEANCEEDLSQCDYNFDLSINFWNSFLTEVGKTYLIRLYDQQNEPEFHFQVNCFNPAVNDECFNAQELTCGDLIDIDLTFASNMGIVTECNPFNNQLPDLWYTITGNDQFIDLSFDNASGSTGVNVDLYSFTCQEIELDCPESGNIYQNNSFSFFAELDSVYLIRLSDERNAQATITINCQPSEINDNCNDAIEMTCGESIAANTNFATSTMNFNGCSSEVATDVWYTISGTGDIFEFNLLSSETGLLDIQIFEEPCGNNYLICNDFISLNNNYGNGQTGYFFSQVGTEYFLRVMVGYDESGSFEFEINCLEPAANNNCENAIPVNCSDIITANSLFSSNSVSDLDCYNSFASTDLWYYLEGDGMIYYFDLLYSPGYSKYVYIFPDSCPADNCGDQISLEVYSNSSDIFYAEPGVNYWIAITSNNNDKGEFSLTINCTDPVENDDCDQAFTVNCNETIIGSTAFALPPNSYANPDVWYTFIGTGDLVQFSHNFAEVSRIQITIYTQGCEDNSEFEQELEISSIRDLNFLTEAGVTYYLQITTGHSQNTSDFSFDMNCIDPLENDSCEGATMLSCGDIINDDTNMASHINNYNNCFYESQPDLWYTINGSDQIIDISLLNSSTGAVYFELYEGNCSDQYDNCLSNFTLYGNTSASYFTQSGKSYLMRVHTSDFGGLFSFQITCQAPVSNNDCESAKSISCGEIVIGNTTLAGSTGEYSYCIGNPNQSDLWYRITGNDEIIELSYLYSSAQGIFVNIFSTNSCSDVINSCPESLFLSNHTTNNLFYGYASVEYLMRVSIGQDVLQNGEFSFELNCYDPVENDFCSGAIDITCGQEIMGSLSLATSENIFCDQESVQQPGVWYTFESNGEQVYNINIEGDFEKALYIFEDNCNTSNCIESITDYYDSAGFPFTVNLPVGTYSILVSSLDYSREDFTLNLSCQASKDNDLCINATDLLCNSSVIDSLKFATALEDPLICSYQNSYGPGLWYSFTGTGESIQISLTSEYQNPELVIFENNCEVLSCLHYFYNGNASYYIQTEIDKSYLLYVTDNEINDLYGEFTISLACNFITQSDPCNCNNDQSSNGAQDGTFTEEIIVENSNPNDIWEIINIESLTGTELPTGIDIGDQFEFDGDDFHSVSFNHIDDSGYIIQIVGPESLGNYMNDTITISNICGYPEIETDRLLTSFNKPESYDLSEWISEINGHSGTFEFYINGKLGSIIESDTLALGEQTLEVFFKGNAENNITQDGITPAFPGCETQVSLTFIIEEQIIESIPTLSEWGLICLSLILMIIAIVSIKDNVPEKKMVFGKDEWSLPESNR